MRLRALIVGCGVVGCGVVGATLGVGTVGAAAAAPAAIRTSTTVAVSPTTAHPYETLTLTATVTTTTGVTPTGTVDLTRGGQTLCSAVAVDPASGTASCTPAGALVVGTTVVTAVFTPTAGAGFGTSRGRTPSTVVAWTPTVTGTASAGAGGCTNAQALHVVVLAPDAAAAATAHGLPKPTGTVTAAGFTGTVTNGVADFCAVVFSSSLSYTYSGDANYAPARSSLGVNNPNHTGPAGSGNPADDPTTAAPTLAATGPGTGLVPAVLLGLGLLLAGGVVVVGARARRET